MFLIKFCVEKLFFVYPQKKIVGMMIELWEEIQKSIL